MDTPSLPTGTVTFLFTDIEGSTKLWDQHPEAMRGALARHDALLQAAIETHGGHVFKTVGDQFCAAFASAPDALAAAISAQQALQAEPWEQTGPLRVRMALHTGTAEHRQGDYFGPPLNRVARLLVVGHGGQVLLSQAAADQVQTGFPPAASLRDLGSHRLKDLQQPEHLFQLLSPTLPAEFPPLRSLEAFAHNLPAQLTRFVGREQEITALKALLAEARLLTLTGVGGTGKTRLALQVAADLLEEYPDGVWLVELAPLADPALVPQTVAAALGVREEPGRPLTATLTDHLRPKSLLLVLDNCEHLLTACAQLADALLRACPTLRILASSREGLGIGGEQTYRVSSLSLPDSRHLPPLERLQEFESVQLFADRARLGQATSAVTQANAPAVVQVCERLDGIPLAIELAAARVKLLSVEQIAQRLDDRFRLLTGGSRTVLPRQQTLRALIDWSYELLSEAERVLLCRLSVFAGGFTLVAAEVICAGEVIEAFEVLDLLGQLVDKSLAIGEERAGEVRYRLLETIREYGVEKLAGSGEEEALRGRHRDWFLALVEQAEPELRGRAQGEWLARLEGEHENLRAVLAGAMACGDVETGLRLGAALGRFWAVRGYLSEGREWLTGLLASAGVEARTTARALALIQAGSLAWLQGDYPSAGPLLEEGLAISRELGDRHGVANSLSNLGLVAYFRGDYATARTFHEESLAIRRALDDQQGIAASLNNLANVADSQGDYSEALALYEEGLALARELGDQCFIAISLNELGILVERQGDYSRARALYEESLVICRELRNQMDTAEGLEGLAAVADAHGQPERAARLFGAAAALREAIGAPVVPYQRVDYERRVAAVRTMLGEQQFASAWAEGRALRLDEAIDLALQDSG